MPSRLAQLLADVFPTLASVTAPAPSCWAAKVLQRDPQQLGDLSAAIDVVDRLGQLPKFKRRLKQEHPVGKAHIPQYDGRLLDCLTEACAFAWADLAGLGVPQFDYRQGAPDILIPPDTWIEAKAMHPSKAASEEMERMARGQVSMGTVGPISATRQKALTDAFVNAQQKFARQPGGRFLVFFNLTSVDVDQIPNADGVLDEYRKLVEQLELANRGTGITLCYGYRWQNPIRYPS